MACGGFSISILAATIEAYDVDVIEAGTKDHGVL